MKAFGLGFLIALILPVSAKGLDLSRPDQKSHAAASFGLDSVIYMTMRNRKYTKAESLFGAMAITLFLGTVKEVCDEPIQFEDMEANAAGVGTGFLLMLAFDWN